MDSDFEKFSFIDILKMLPFIPSFLPLKRTRIEKFLRKFKNPLLQEMLFQMFPVRAMPALMVVMPLAYFNNKQGGYPLGGSLNLSRSIEKKYLSLGGTIQYQQKISKIIVENYEAKGVETEKGEKYFADIIISVCDGRSTLYDMLEGKYLTPKLEKFYNNPSLWPPLISISLGINRDLSQEVALVNFKLKKPVQICNQKVEWMSYAHYSHDPNFAPIGKIVLKTQIETDYNYWRELSKNKEEYES